MTTTDSVPLSVPLNSSTALQIVTTTHLTKLQQCAVQFRAMLIKVRSMGTAAASGGAQEEIAPLMDYIIALLGTGLDEFDNERKKVGYLLNTLQPLRRVGKQLVVPNGGSGAVTTSATVTTATFLSLKRADYKLILEQLIEIVDSVVTTLKKKPATKLEFDIGVLKDLITPLELLSMFNYTALQGKKDPMHLVKLPVLVKALTQGLAPVKTYSDLLFRYSANPTNASIKKLPHWPYTLHRVLASVLRILDLHSTIRQISRGVVIPLLPSLRQTKILYTHKKLAPFLIKVEKIFDGKENTGRLVAFASKVSRFNETTILTHDVAVDLAKYVVEGVKLVEEMLALLNDFVKNWESLDPLLKKLKIQTEANVDSAKTRGRSESLPSSPTISRTSSLVGSTVSPIVSPEASNKTSIVSRARSGSNNLVNVPTMAPPNITTTTISTTATPTPVRTRARSGSNASLTSNSSANSSTSTLNALRVPQVKPTPFSPPPPVRSPTVSPALSRSSSLRSRPQSMVINQAFDVRSEMRRREKAAAAAAAVSSPPTPAMAGTNGIVGRRRSSSLQGTPSPSRITSSPPVNNNDHNDKLRNSAASAASLLAQPRRSATAQKNRASSLTSIDERTHVSRLGVPTVHMQTARSTSPSPRRSAPSEQLTPSKPAKQGNSNSKVQGRPVIKIRTDFVERANVGSPDSPLKSAMRTSGTIKDSTTANVSAVADTDQNGTLDSVEATADYIAQLDIEERPSTPPPSRPIIKKVRFTGVPPSPPSPVSKKRLFPLKPKSPSRLAHGGGRANDTLKQERLAFHSIRRGELDVRTGKVHVPRSGEGERMMGSLAGVGTGIGAAAGKNWKSFRDRFS